MTCQLSKKKKKKETTFMYITIIKRKYAVIAENNIYMICHILIYLDMVLVVLLNYVIAEKIVIRV